MAEVRVSFPVSVIGDEATYAEDPNTGLVATDSGPKFMTIAAGEDQCLAVFSDRATAQDFIDQDGIEGAFVGEIATPVDLIALLRRTEPSVTHMAFDPSRRTGLVMKESIPRAIAVLERAIDEGRRN
jgi:hypothetical protein